MTSPQRETEVKLEWLRLGQGSTKHLCLPDWLHSVGSLGGPHRWTLCSRTGVPNMEPFTHPRQGGYGMATFDPQDYPECKKCSKLFAELITVASLQAVAAQLGLEFGSTVSQMAHALRVRERQQRRQSRPSKAGQGEARQAPTRPAETDLSTPIRGTRRRNGAGRSG